MSKKENKSLESIVFFNSFRSNAISVVIDFMVINCFVMLQPRQFPVGLVFVTVFFVIAQFLLSPLANKTLLKDLPKRVQKWKNGAMTDAKERTALFEDLMKFPQKKGMETLGVFFASGIIFCIGYHFLPTIQIEWKAIFFAFPSAFLSGYLAAFLTATSIEKVCNKYAEKLIVDGLDVEYVVEKKNFGMPIMIRGVMFFIVPLFLDVLLSLLIFVQGYGEVNGIIPMVGSQIARMAFINVICIFCAIYMPLTYWKTATKSNDGLCKTIESVLQTYSFEKSADIPLAATNLNGKMQYNIFVLNEIVKRFKEILELAKNSSVNVLEQTQNLSVTAKEFSSTSVEQNTSIKEILTAVEHENDTLQKIREQIAEMTAGSTVTNEDVSSGRELLDENTAQIEFISEANQKIISHINELEKQVENIGNVVTMIKDIADQTRIIAFNAELEAVSAGKEGMNFHIVAAETRRLANSTMESINNIRTYIESIQMAAKALVDSSFVQTQRIQEEMQMTGELVSNFKAIQNSADRTSKKATEIASVVDQQSSSFNQIVVTLRQISAGIESFTDSASVISSTADQIKKEAEALENLKS